MQFVLFIAIIQLIIFYKKYNVVKAMTGINVRDANQGEFSMAVAILNVRRRRLIDPETAFRCTATLVTREHVLSTSQCLKDVRLNDILVTAGTLDLRAGLQYPMYWWIHYNEWANAMQLPHQFQINDVAMIKLNMQVSTDVQPAILTNLTYNQLFNKDIKIGGWSRLTSGNLNPIQQIGELKLLSKEECDESLSRITGATINADERILCSSAMLHVILQDGDNGDPTILNQNELVAIAIGTCPNPNHVPVDINMHVSIDYYKNFILYMINHF